MKLTHVCITTSQVQNLVAFYEKVLQIKPDVAGPNYAEFATESGCLAVFSVTEHNKLAPDSADSAANRSVLIEFRVDDVHVEYDRLRELEIEWVRPPTTQPWGNCSIYFRDPDGNLVNFYSRQ